MKLPAADSSETAILYFQAGPGRSASVQTRLAGGTAPGDQSQSSSLENSGQSAASQVDNTGKWPQGELHNRDQRSPTDCGGGDCCEDDCCEDDCCEGNCGGEESCEDECCEDDCCGEGGGEVEEYRR